MHSITNVINGDCLEGLTLMEDEIADLALIDAPYFDYKSNHRKDKSDVLSKGIIQQPQEEQIRTILECIRILKTNSAFFLFTNWENIYWMQQPLRTHLRNMIIWDKGNWTAGDLNGSFGNRYEIIFLGVKGKDWKYRGGRDNDIWRQDEKYMLNRPSGKARIHPTEKPVDLYRKCIEVACDEGALIIDPYGGSGSSAEAAVLTNRNIIVYEKDVVYYNKIMERLRNCRERLAQT
jgi:site-specific DNA-methyltransferase (adenine-specific)